MQLPPSKLLLPKRARRPAVPPILNICIATPAPFRGRTLPVGREMRRALHAPLGRGSITVGGAIVARRLNDVSVLLNTSKALRVPCYLAEQS